MFGLVEAETISFCASLLVLSLFFRTVAGAQCLLETFTSRAISTAGATKQQNMSQCILFLRDALAMTSLTAH